jgi:hypothetical protein
MASLANMSTPEKGSMTAHKSISSNKCTNTRKLVFVVQAGAIAHVVQLPL